MVAPNVRPRRYFFLHVLSLQLLLRIYGAERPRMGDLSLLVAQAHLRTSLPLRRALAPKVPIRATCSSQAVCLFTFYLCPVSLTFLSGCSLT